MLGYGVFLWPVIHAGIGLALLVPTMVVVLGTIVRAFLLATALLTATAATYVGFQSLMLRAGPAFRPALAAAAGLPLTLPPVPGQAILRAAIDRVVFHRRRQRWAELQAFVQTLSPELGIDECCRRILGELVRVMQLRGAAIVLRDGTGFTHGAF